MNSETDLLVPLRPVMSVLGQFPDGARNREVRFVPTSEVANFIRSGSIDGRPIDE
jgi:hypothetical protein